MKTENIEKQLERENIYQLNVADMKVEIFYSKNNKKIQECMLDVLKRKIKKN